MIVTITAGWQRRTGPSYPLRGNLEVAAGEVDDVVAAITAFRKNAIR